jgi:psiF repeat
MKKLLTLVLLGLFVVGGSAFAADTKDTKAKDTKAAATDTKTAASDKAPSDAQKAQQDKMKMCNQQAGDKKGDERQAFMKTCLSAKPEKPKNKMAMCNEKTKGMSKPDADKARSECMKAS